MNKSSVPNWANEHDWYHEIDLGNGVIINKGGGQPNLKLVYSLLNQLDLKGRVCLDIGTWDGKMAFEMEKRGANKVIAADVEDRPTFHLLHKHFNSKVKYFSDVHVDNLSNHKIRDEGPFDFVILSGVLFHIFNPLLVLGGIRSLMKPGGLIIVENACLDRNDVAMHFNQDGRFYMDLTTFWLMSIQCFRYLLGFCCFQPLQEQTLSQLLGKRDVVRHAILARAVKPSKIKEVDEWLYRFAWKGKNNPKQFPPLNYFSYESQDYDENEIIKCVNKLSDMPLVAKNNVHWWAVGDSLKQKLYRKFFCLLANFKNWF
jgi:tRNA (mo5U34)-methyltransferase